MAKITLKKIVEAKQHKGAVWAVKGAEHIRIHEIGNTWFIDEYRNGEYVRNIMKHYRSAYRKLIKGRGVSLLHGETNDY